MIFSINMDNKLQDRIRLAEMKERHKNKLKPWYKKWWGVIILLLGAIIISLVTMSGIYIYQSVKKINADREALYSGQRPDLIKLLVEGQGRPYLGNPESEIIFNSIKEKIHAVLGDQFEVLHRGSSALGIAGQKEIDIYIPVAEEDMDKVVKVLEQLYGIPPKSIYIRERIKFLQDVNGTRIEVMVVNKSHTSWVEGETFFERIKDNSSMLKEYEQLKREASRLPYKEYQDRKVAFFNKVIGKDVTNKI